MQELEHSTNREEYLFGNVYGQVEYPEWASAKLNIAYKTYSGETDRTARKRFMDNRSRR